MRCRGPTEDPLDPGEEAAGGCRGRCGRWCRCRGRCARPCRAARALGAGLDRGRGLRCHGLGRQGGRFVADHALDHRLLLGLGPIIGIPAARDGHLVCRLLDHRVGGAERFQARVVVAQALELVVRRLQVRVRNQQHVQALLEFDARNLLALLIEQEGHHLHRHLHVHGSGVVLHRLFLHHAQNLQGRAFGITDVAGALAARAGDVRAFAQGRTQALARHLQQAELADGGELNAGTVLAQGVLQALLHVTAVLALLHVDEVDDDQAAQVAQPALPRDLVGGLEVGARGGFLDVAAARGAGGVHVDGHQRLGVVDHDGAARGQVDRAAEGCLDLVFDLKAREQRRVVTVALHAMALVGHHVVHELVGLLEDVVGVDQDLADVRGEVVADGADDQRAFLIDQVGTLARPAGLVDGRPQLEHVVQVPLQLGGAAADTGGAGDQAHPLGVVELIHVLLELFPVIPLDAARNTTASRVVGHEHQVAPGQGNEGGERRTLVAAFFLFHLHQQLGAVGDHVLDLGVAHGNARLEVLLGDFLEGQEAVAVLAVVDEAGLQGGLHPRDHGLVDVALALFAPFNLGFEVEELLSFDDRQAPLFGLRGVDQHALHVHSRAALPFARLLLDRPCDAHTARGDQPPAAMLAAACAGDMLGMTFSAHTATARCTSDTEKPERNRPGLRCSGRAVRLRPLKSAAVGQRAPRA